MVTLLMQASTLTVKEVARMLHVHENTVRRWSDRGIIESRRICKRGDRRFNVEDVEILLIRLRQNFGDERKAALNNK